MQPPGMKKKPGLMIAVGVGKPKGGPMRPPGMDDDEGIDHVEEHDTDDESGGKVSREKALVVPEDHHCSECLNYDATSGECSKVEGIFEAQDACLRYFKHAQPEDEESEPDEDDRGGAPDMDSDDVGAA